jgi:hypothetical protein
MKGRIWISLCMTFMVFLAGCGSVPLVSEPTQSPSTGQLIVETTARIALRHYLVGERKLDKAQNALDVLERLRATVNGQNNVTLDLLKAEALAEIESLHRAGKIDDLDAADSRDLVGLFSSALEGYVARTGIDPARQIILFGDFLDSLIAEIPVELSP